MPFRAHRESVAVFQIPPIKKKKIRVRKDVRDDRCAGRTSYISFLKAADAVSWPPERLRVEKFVIALSCTQFDSKKKCFVYGEEVIEGRLRSLDYPAMPKTFKSSTGIKAE